MTKLMQDDERPEADGKVSVRVRLPGFIHDEQVGLGNMVQRVTYAFGLKTCGGCESRAAAMNRWMVFTR